MSHSIPQVKPEIIAKWADVMDVASEPKLARNLRGAVAQILENTKTHAPREAASIVTEGTPITLTGAIAKFDPVLLAMARRVTPQLMANDFYGVQAMELSTGMVFAKRTRYTNAAGAEAFINEPNTAFTGVTGGAYDAISDIFNEATGSPAYTTGTADATANKEGDITAAITATFESYTVTAKSRTLMTSYSVEAAYDLMNTHKLDLDNELITDLQEEMTQEINRELARTIYIVSKLGSENTTTPGTYDLDADNDGRYFGEKWKGLMFQIDLEANKVWRETLRGRGNKIIVSVNVASALAATGMLDMQGWQTTQVGSLNVDPIHSTYVGRLNGMYDVHVDPWIVDTNFAVVGFKGTSQFDAGLFFMPYVPLSLYRATDPTSFQPRIGLRTRYATAQAPYIMNGGTPYGQTIAHRVNPFFRKFKITNL